MRLFLFIFLPFAALFCSEGLEYTSLEFANSTCHIIEIDPALYEIRPAKALDNGIGRESVLSINERLGAAASVNGGFFTIGGTFDGKACGALKIHDWYALPFKPRGCIGWSNGDAPKMDRLLVQIKAKCGSDEFAIERLNDPRKEREMVLFTPCFHRTTLTNPDGEEIVVVDGVIRSIVKGGSSKIPENGQVLSIQRSHPLFNRFQEGMSLEFSIRADPQLGDDDWEHFDYIVGGTPLLIHQRSRIFDFEDERTRATFLTHKHARTAVGILPNGHWLLVVVDKTGPFDGMTMAEMAEFMARLGSVDALNLDGGGSSTMVCEGVVKNSPHGDEDEGNGQAMVRRVSDALVVIPNR